MAHSDPVRALERDLRAIFGGRLQSLSTYAGAGGQDAGAHGADVHGADVHGAVTHTLVIVDTLTVNDLRACASRAGAWHGARLATPLLLAAHEFESALDAFPLEFGAILASHTVVSGKAPFDGLTVDPADLRRAVEVQARSHLLHLREGYVETAGRADALALLIVDSAAAFRALLESVRRVDRSFDAGPAARSIVALAGAHDLASPEAERLFPGYLEAVERLVRHVDQWTA